MKSIEEKSISVTDEYRQILLSHGAIEFDLSTEFYKKFAAAWSDFFKGGGEGKMTKDYISDLNEKHGVYSNDNLAGLIAFMMSVRPKKDQVVVAMSSESRVVFRISH